MSDSIHDLANKALHLAASEIERLNSENERLRATEERVRALRDSWVFPAYGTRLNQFAGNPWYRAGIASLDAALADPEGESGRCAQVGSRNGWCDQPRPCPTHDALSGEDA